jgi:hypothetical protein
MRGCDHPSRRRSWRIEDRPAVDLNGQRRAGLAGELPDQRCRVRCRFNPGCERRISYLKRGRGGTAPVLDVDDDPREAGGPLMFGSLLSRGSSPAEFDVNVWLTTRSRGQRGRTGPRVSAGRAPRSRRQSATRNPLLAATNNKPTYMVGHLSEVGTVRQIAGSRRRVPQVPLRTRPARDFHPVGTVR